ncbi:MAG: hypothetical protein CBC35_04765 [Planctomycetes bacterium TMED75]|nr:hypothetical protein [Planctomycetaceae bacterium]OUU93901.1 MAG: hypothetical protein CBC35_04765 [Planctomycetes bacterium TMED75]
MLRPSSYCLLLGCLATALPASLGASAVSPHLPDQEATTPAETPAEAPPVRIFVVVDRFKEFGGILIQEDERSFVVRRDEREETYEKDKVLGFITLLELSEEGSDGIVRLRDGSQISGRVIEDGFEQVTLLIEGIHHQIPRAEVSHINLAPSFERELEVARASIDQTNGSMRVELAQWIMERGRLDLAQAELQEILQMEDNPRARQLMELVEARIALEAEGRDTRRPLPPKSDRTTGLPDRTLTAEDVNLIRVYEIDFRRPPQVEVDPKTIRKLIENHAANALIPNQKSRQEQLFGLDDLDQVKLIFDVQARELYPEIQVKGEPHSLNVFRTKVHNAWLIRNCATSGCHGGVNAGNFFLHRYGMNTPKTLYENLLILERTKLEGPHKLIDYENPRMSLLIQYALPQSEARIKHPAVPGFSPAFPSGGGKTMADTLEFIEAMYQPRPYYPVEYEAPVLTNSPQGSTLPRITR